MKIVLILLLSSFSMCQKVFAQTESDFLSNTLNYLNENLELRLETKGKPIIIAYEGFYYLCLDFAECDSIVSFEKMKIRLAVKKLDNNKFWFRYTYVYTHEGEFEVFKENDTYIFKDLHYVMYID